MGTVYVYKLGDTGWSLNVQQTPRAVVEIGTDKVAVTARRASEQERERLWIVITATYAGYARYQERTTRRILVVRPGGAGGRLGRGARDGDDDPAPLSCLGRAVARPGL